MTLWQTLLLMPLSFLGAWVYGLSGFGSGLITVPLAALFFDLKWVLPVFALIDLLNALRVWAVSPRTVSRPDLLRLLPSCLMGVVLGAWLLLVLPVRGLMIGFGLFVLAAALQGLLQGRALSLCSLRWAVPAGLAGGLASALFGAGGPPVAIYLSRRPIEKDAMRATQSLTSLVSITARVLAFAAAGLYADGHVLRTALLLTPAALLALWLAQRQHARWSRDQVLRLIHLVLLLAGLSLLLRAWFLTG